MNQYSGVAGQAYSYYPEGPLWQGGTLTHYYDELNAQVSATGPGGASLSWSRDALGAQAYGGKVSATATTSTAYGHDGSRPEAIIERIAVTPAGASQPSTQGDREFVLGPEPDERLAFIATTGLVFYPHVDRQGSTIALSGARMAQSQWSYGPYGESPDAVVATSPGPSSYGYRYTGQRYDSDFALYDDKARTYSPALGRFLQPDPAGLDQGPNLYGYVSNDPLGAEDPTGMDTCTGSLIPGPCSSSATVVASYGNVKAGSTQNGQGALPPDQSQTTSSGAGSQSGVRLAMNLAQPEPEEADELPTSEPAVRTSQDLERELFERERPNISLSGYDVLGFAEMHGRTAVLNIGAIERTVKSEGLKALDAEIVSAAKTMGASRIQINGFAIRNAGFLNPSTAARFGYSFRLLPGGNGVSLTKSIK